MTYEHETSETVVQRRPVTTETSETIVTSSSSSPMGLIGAIVAAILVVLVAIWLFNGGLSGNREAVTVDLPSVTVSP